MKAIILAGGFGSRLSEETAVRPKPMVEIGGMPIVWHIMKGLSVHGIDDFVLCLGYKGDVIKEWFASYFLRMSDVTLDLREQRMEVHDTRAEPWRVSCMMSSNSSARRCGWTSPTSPKSCSRTRRPPRVPCKGWTP